MRAMSDQTPKQSPALAPDTIATEPTNQDTPWSIRLCKQMVDAFGEGNTDRAQVLARLLLLQDNMLFRVYAYLVSSSLLPSPAPLCVVIHAIMMRKHLRVGALSSENYFCCTLSLDTTSSLSKALCISILVPDTTPTRGNSCSKLTI